MKGINKMIIVSQDRRKIINFNNIREIMYIDNEKQKELIKDMGLDIFDSVIKETMRISVKDIEGYGIYVYFDNGDSTILGQYKTEERAKEVLKMIVSEYQSCKLFQCTNNDTQEEMAKKYQEFSITPFKFEMPKE